MPGKVPSSTPEDFLFGAMVRVGGLEHLARGYGKDALFGGPDLARTQLSSNGIEEMLLQRTLCTVAGLMVYTVCYGAAVEKLPPRLDDALEAWETSAESLRTYDMYLHVETVFVMKTVVVGKIEPKGKALPGVEVPGFPVIELRERGPGEVPGKRVQFSRQVLSREGKRRYELRNLESENWIEAKVFNGEIVRAISARKVVTSRIHGHGPDKLYFTNPELSYAALYHDMPFGGPLIKLLRSREGTRLVGDPSGKPEYVDIESLPEKGGDYPAFGWRIALDPAYGMMPVEIEFFKDTMKMPIRRTVIEEFHEVEAGVWAPIKARQEAMDPKGRIATVTHLVVDMERSAWNQPVQEELFTLVIPEGTSVVDDTRNIAFIAGEGDTGGNVDRLVEGARNVLKLSGRGEPGPTGAGSFFPTSRAILIWVNIVALAVILGIVLLRLRRRRML